MAPLVEQLLEAQQQRSAPEPRRASARVASLPNSYESLKSVGERTRVRTSKMISWQESSDRCLEKFQPREFRKDDLRPVYHLSLKDAAVQLGICATTLKRVCRRLGIRKWPRRALARLSQHQDSATQPKASHKLEQACSEPHSPQLQTCGSGSSSATVIFKGSQSPPEALSPWAQPGCSEEFDLYEFGGDPSHKPASVVPHMPEMHQGNDWNDPLPFVLDSWELDGAPEMKLQQAHMSADCPSSLQQPPFHDPADVAGSRAVQLSWDDIPGSFPFPGSNVGDLQRDMPCGYDQSCFMDSWSDLALLQRALKQPDPATCHFPQQPGLQPALQPAPQPAIHTSFPPALWDSHADDLAIAPAHIPATLMPPAYRPPQDVQAAGFAAPYKMDWPLAPTPDNSMDHDALDYSPQQGPAINAGPILRGRVITPDEYRVQAISRRGRF